MATSLAGISEDVESLSRLLCTASTPYSALALTFVHHYRLHFIVVAILTRDASVLSSLPFITPLRVLLACRRSSSTLPLRQAASSGSSLTRPSLT